MSHSKLNNTECHPKHTVKVLFALDVTWLYCVRSWSCFRLPDALWQLTPWSTGLPEKLKGPKLLNKFPTFYEPEGSSPHSQEPHTCPYPEPDQSCPCFPNPLIENTFYCYPLIYAWVFQLVSFPEVYPPKHCTHLSCLPCGLHTPPV